MSSSVSPRNFNSRVVPMHLQGVWEYTFADLNKRKVFYDHKPNTYPLFWANITVLQIVTSNYHLSSQIFGSIFRCTIHELLGI